MAVGKKARVLRMLFCDFCGGSQETCLLLIQGRDEVHICDKCVDVCAGMVLDHHKKQQPTLLESARTEAAVHDSGESAQDDPAR
jgi:ATP-dependent protease Clp ATPase subunit